MGFVEQKRRTGAEVDIGVLAVMERKFLENCLTYLSEVDGVAVNFAKFRLDILKEISTANSVEARSNLWDEVEETDRAHVYNDVYSKAVWILEAMVPSLKAGDKDSGHVVLFLTGNGSAYAKDQKGNIRKKVTA
ncbi:MAG: hypothetical protein AAB512_04895 [Patescibacteria group bacterium]